MVKLGRTMAIALGVMAVGCAAAWAGNSVPVTRVPEPATLGLIASGIAGVAFVRRLRRRK